jgi:hypothetical protein
MSGSIKNVIAVAREIIARYGRDAASMVDRRARENRSAGDNEAAAFWALVAQAIRALDPKPQGSAAPSLTRITSSP